MSAPDRLAEIMGRLPDDGAVFSWDDSIILRKLLEELKMWRESAHHENINILKEIQEGKVKICTVCKSPYGLSTLTLEKKQ